MGGLALAYRKPNSLNRPNLKTKGKPMEEVAIADAAITILETIIPKITAAVKGGQVDPATQQALADRMTALESSGFKFTRPVVG
jgi:hypothetical protein